MEQNPFVALFTSSVKPAAWQIWAANILWVMFQKLWGKLSDAHKRILAQELAEKMVDEKIKPYREYNNKLQEEIDQLKAAGKTMTEERKKEVHREKAALELDLWNSKP